MAQNDNKMRWMEQKQTLQGFTKTKNQRSNLKESIVFMGIFQGTEQITKFTWRLRYKISPNQKLCGFKK